MKLLFNLILFTVFTLVSYAQSTNQYSDFSVPTHKCEFSNNSSDAFLYKGQNYEYYSRKFKNAQKLKSPGIFFSILGVGSIAWGIAKQTNYPYYLGAVMLNAGIPLWIIGGIKSKNNQKAMNNFPEHQPKLSFAFTNNGLGLVLKF